ncbi:MAG TPA: Maf family protein [Pyrinomonadaceae bacterium]|jgi:septum formation protein|nr:Maf family protein [Pyrinomonadaceae bacterium]
MEKESESQATRAGFEAGEIFPEPLVLASASPRRAEILRAVACPFEQLAVDIDETRLPSEGAVAYVERLAQEKAEAGAKVRTGRLVLGADTVVVVDDRILGKPIDQEDARRMLRLLSGRWHEVLTGVALVRAAEARASRRVVAHEMTRVRFAEMSGAEIDWYVATGEPLDKAGAYAVQGRAALFIEELRGDCWNVVGLPVQLVYKLARSVGPN